MNIVATRTQLKSLTSNNGNSFIQYTQTLGQVVSCIVDFQPGWLGALISGSYSVTNFLTDFPNATEVTGITL